MAGGERGTPIGTRYVERFLRTAFNPVGVAQYGQSILGPIQPSIDVRPSWAWEFRDFLMHPWRRLLIVSAVAAQFGYVEIGPPLTADYDIIVTDIANSSSIPLNIFENNTTQGAGTVQSLLEQDSIYAQSGGGSYGTIAAPVLSRTATIAAIAGTQTDQIATNAIRENQRYVLRAGTGAPFLVVAGNTVNTAIVVIVGGIAIPTNVSNI